MTSICCTQLVKPSLEPHCIFLTSTLKLCHLTCGQRHFEKSKYTFKNIIIKKHVDKLYKKIKKNRYIKHTEQQHVSLTARVPGLIHQTEMWLNYWFEPQVVSPHNRCQQLSSTEHSPLTQSMSQTNPMDAMLRSVVSAPWIVPFAHH